MLMPLLGEWLIGESSQQTLSRHQSGIGHMPRGPATSAYVANGDDVDSGVESTYVHVAGHGPMGFSLHYTWPCHVILSPLSERPPIADFKPWPAVSFGRKMTYTANRGRRIGDKGLFGVILREKG